ncbi:TniQ family protein [Leptospira sp. SA-E8]|uniref:TniQ family protein n=1 Tax=Leptospira sp. SA-E8 TaxID=3422259 RepID=UPI003EC0C09A
MHRMFGRVISIDPRGERYLLNQDGYPKYRYCHRCLSEQRTKYFPLEWRFKAWRFCPIHNELLQDFCPHCRAIVVLPNDQFMSGRLRDGVDCIAECFVCGNSLYRDRPPLRFDVSRRQLSTKETVLVRNGRAVLAAFNEGRVRVPGQPQTGSLRYLNVFERSGFLPHEWNFFEDHGVSHIKYRHPISHQIIHLNKEPSLRRRPWMAGLFDG